MPQRRGRNRGNRDRDRGRSKSRSSRRDYKGKGKDQKDQKRKKTLADHIFNVGKAQDASDYVTNSKFIIRYIQTNYDKGGDITKALKEEKHIDFSKMEPRLKISTIDKSKAEDKYNQETAEFMEQYKIRMESHMAREEKYQDNCVKAAGLLIQQCSTAMKYKLQARNDYDKIEMDPVSLLQAIKEAAMNYEADEYVHKTIQEALKSFVNLKQRQGESLNDYLERFMTAKSVLWAHVGKDFTKMLQTDEKWIDAEAELILGNETPMKELKKRVAEGFITYHFMANADQTKYGSLMEGFKTQHNMKKNDPNADATKKYPAVMDTATSVFQGHTWDKTYHEKNKKDRQNKKTSPQKDQKDNSSGSDVANLSFAQLSKGSCYCCGQRGHPFSDCPKKATTPKSQWHINKNKEVQQYNKIVDEIVTHSTLLLMHLGRRIKALQLHPKPQTPKMLGLDTTSLVDLNAKSR